MLTLSTRATLLHSQLQCQAYASPSVSLFRLQYLDKQPPPNVLLSVPREWMQLPSLVTQHRPRIPRNACNPQIRLFGSNKFHCTLLSFTSPSSLSFPPFPSSPPKVENIKALLGDIQIVLRIALKNGLDGNSNIDQGGGTKFNMPVELGYVRSNVPTCSHPSKNTHV